MALVAPRPEITGVESVFNVAWNLGLFVLNNFDFTVNKVQNPTGISIELISNRTSVVAAENLSTTSRASTSTVKHRTILPLVEGNVGVIVPDQQITTIRNLAVYDGTTDYGGTSGFTETTVLANNYHWLHNDAAMLSAMNGSSGTFTLTMRVVHQDSHSSSTFGLMSWANSDWINGILVVRVLTG